MLMLQLLTFFHLSPVQGEVEGSRLYKSLYDDAVKYYRSSVATTRWIIIDIWWGGPMRELLVNLAFWYVLIGIMRKKLMTILISWLILHQVSHGGSSSCLWLGLRCVKLNVHIVTLCCWTTSSTICDCSFPVIAVRIWNSLPASVFMATTLKHFQKSLKTLPFCLSFP